MAYIERAIAPVLKRRAGQSKCLLVTGARQVGKSTVLAHEFPGYNSVTFDDRMVRAQVREEPNLFFMNNPAPLIIDEVQKEPAILEDVKIRLDRSSERGRYIFTGSQNLELMKGISESLSGRVSVMELAGLSMREIKQIGFNRHFVPTEAYLSEREKCLQPYEDVWQVIHRGSYPELYDVERDWADFYSSYVNTYIEKDINEMVTGDGVTFTRFLTAAAARTGEILNYSSIAGDVGVSEPTIRNWISILVRTGIIYLLQPYSASALSRVIKSPKLYFRDTGLAAYLTRWTSAEALKVSAVAGSMFETFVVSEILKSFANEGLNYDLSVYYYRGKDKSSVSDNEIDLIIEENGTLYPVEIKMTANPKAQMGGTNRVLDRIKEKERGMGVVLCMTDREMYLRENLVALPISYV